MTRAHTFIQQVFTGLYQLAQKHVNADRPLPKKIYSNEGGYHVKPLIYGGLSLTFLAGHTKLFTISLQPNFQTSYVHPSYAPLH